MPIYKLRQGKQPGHDTCEPIPDPKVLDLPDAGALCVDIADGSQLVREVSLLGAEANGMRVLWPQRL